MPNKTINEQNIEELSKYNCNIIKSPLESLFDSKKFNTNKFWKLKKKLFPNQQDRKVPIINSKGTELFEPQAIISEYKHEFINRLRTRKISSDYVSIEDASLRLFNATPNLTLPLKDSASVLKSLKNGKSKDMMGLVNEVIKHGGISFQESLLNLLNKIKNDRTIPIVWNNILIRPIDKKKIC